MYLEDYAKKIRVIKPIQVLVPNPNYRLVYLDQRVLREGEYDLFYQGSIKYVKVDYIKLQNEASIPLSHLPQKCFEYVY